MDFEWSEEQRALRTRVVDFARRELNADTTERDHEGTFGREQWLKCAEFGLQGLSVPSQYNGGMDTDFMTAMLMMEGFGYGCRDNGLAFALNAQMWTVQLPIVQVGSDAQKQRYLPGLCDGSLIGAHAITEPESGSDVFSMRTRARKVEGGYRLNGSKQFVSLAPLADVFLAFATTDPELGKWGVTAFLVDRRRDGLSTGPARHKMGLRTAPLGEVYFDDCFVADDERLGAEGGGVGLSTGFLEWERCCILASQLGAMERQLEESIAYVRERRQFGQPVGKFQSVSNRIADMKLRLETSRLLLYRAAWLKMQGKPALLECAMLKLHLAECFVESSMDAIRVHGGHGYMSDAGIERDLRDAVGGTIYAGTSDIQRNIIAGLLGL